MVLASSNEKPEYAYASFKTWIWSVIWESLTQWVTILHEEATRFNARDVPATDRGILADDMPVHCDGERTLFLQADVASKAIKVSLRSLDTFLAWLRPANPLPMPIFSKYPRRTLIELLPGSGCAPQHVGGAGECN